LIRTRQNTSSAPHASKAAFTWSCGPTETPPETTRMSACSTARSTASRLASRSSRTGGQCTSIAPADWASIPIVYEFDS
jgi:hypothetical protein